MLSIEALDPNDWKTLAPHFDALLAMVLAATDVPEWLGRWSDLEKMVWEARSHLKRAKSLDVTDQTAQQAFNDFTLGTFSHFKFATQQLKTKLLNLSAYHPASQHLELLRRWRNEADLFRPANVPLQAEIYVLANRYDGMVQALNAELLVSDTSNVSRHRRNQYWLQQREPFDQLFLELLRLRRQLAQNAGLSDYRAYRWRELGRLDYAPDDCMLFHEAIATDLIPIARILYKRSSYTSVQERAAHLIFPTNQLFESGMQPVMSAIDPELGSLFGQMRSGFLDLGKRPGKAGGSEEWVFPVTGLPYVRVNAEGTVEGILLILHEMGHAFHDYLSLRDQNLIWNTGGSTEFEEFAAIALTYLALPYLEQAGVYSKSELTQAFADQVTEAITKWVPLIVQIDAFQHWLYTEAPENVEAADLDAQWLALARRFQPASNQSSLNDEDAIGWQQVGLLFQIPFYNIEYALAHLGALQVCQNMEADPARAWQDYRTALALGNTLPLPELYASAGTRLPLDPQLVHEIAQAVAIRLDVQISNENFAIQTVSNL